MNARHGGVNVPSTQYVYSEPVESKECAHIRNNGVKQSKRLTMSQYGQDYILLRVLEMMGYPRGTFIDLAAAFPRKLSNTFLIENCLGWTGICVEGDAQKIPLLKEDRTCRIVDKCISDRREVVNFESEKSSGVSGVRGYAKAAWANLQFKTIETQCYSFVDMIDELGMNGQRVDFMSLDVEGYEGKVLSTMAQSDIKIDIFVPEISHCCLDADSYSQKKLIEFLELNDYVPIMGIGGFDIGDICGHKSSLNYRMLHTPVRWLFDQSNLKEISDVFYVRRDSKYLPYFEKLMKC